MVLPPRLATFAVRVPRAACPTPLHAAMRHMAASAALPAEILPGLFEPESQLQRNRWIKAAMLFGGGLALGKLMLDSTLTITTDSLSDPVFGTLLALLELSGLALPGQYRAGASGAPVILGLVHVFSPALHSSVVRMCIPRSRHQVDVAICQHQ